MNDAARGPYRAHVAEDQQRIVELRRASISDLRLGDRIDALAAFDGGRARAAGPPAAPLMK